MKSISKLYENKDGILLFLDDNRKPIDCIKLMHKKMNNTKIYTEKWNIVRNYKEFVKWITKNGLPDIISFDHDLGDNTKTGYDCAKWLVEYCIDNGLKLPKYYVHSMNPVGTENINKYMENFIRTQK